MAAPMHIWKADTLFGNVKTHCGKVLRPGDGAARNAPLCPTCVKRAGWTTDKRRR